MFYGCNNGGKRIRPFLVNQASKITNINRNMTSNLDDEFIIESGIAKGIDGLIKYKSQKL